MENIFVEFLPPWVETGLQPAFYDKESGTVLQQTARMYARVNMLIRMFNRLSKNTKDEIERFEGVINDEVERFEGVVNDTVEEYIEKFNGLHDYVEDYFENLDVQEEINNKLDDMVTAGTMQTLINNFLNPDVIWGFDTVSAMQSADYLENGCRARTLGFYALGDGGGATYIIRNPAESETANNITTFTVGDYIAELALEESMFAEQFGCKNDGTTDNTAKIQSAVDSGIGVLEFGNGSFLSDAIAITSPITIKGNGTKCIINQHSAIAGGYFKINNTTNVNISGLYFEPKTHTFTQDGRCIDINNSTYVTINDCEFYNMNGDGIIVTKNSDVETDTLHHIYIYDCKFIGTGDGRNPITVFAGNNIYVHDNYFENTTKADMPGCFDIEPYFTSDYLFLHDIYFQNNISHGCKGRMVDGGTASNINMGIYNVVISDNVCDCTAYNSGFFSFSYGSPATGDIHNFVVKNNVVNCNKDTNRAITLNGMKNVDIVGNVFNNGWITLGGALSNSVTDTNIKIIGNTFTRTASSDLIGTQFINIRLATDQVVDIIDNKFIYETNQYVQPLMFLPANDQPTPTRIAVWSNTFLRPTTTTAATICTNYTADMQGNVKDSYLS